MKRMAIVLGLVGALAAAPASAFDMQGFASRNSAALRDAAAREICVYRDPAGFVGAAKVILLQDRETPSFPQLSRSKQTEFLSTMEVYARRVREAC